MNFKADTVSLTIHTCNGKRGQVSYIKLNYVHIKWKVNEFLTYMRDDDDDNVDADKNICYSSKKDSFMTTCNWKK